MKRFKTAASLLSVLSIVGLVAFFSFYLGTAHVEDALASESKPLHQMQPDDVVIGEEAAPITIVEYSSLSCPHCAAFHRDVFPKLKEQYIDTGKVKFTNRQLPLNEPALRAGMLVHCVGKERNPQFTKVLFELQDKWAFGSDFLDSLKKIAAVGGFSNEDFDKCMADKSVEEKILKSRQDAVNQLNINSTPSFFVNGKELKGSITLPMIEKAIADADSAKAE
jgi:protein-disulfide isomerase